MTFKNLIKEHTIENGLHYVNIDFVVDTLYYNVVFEGFITYDVKSNRLYHSDTTIEQMDLHDDADIISFLSCVEEGIERLLKKSNKDGYKTLVNDGYLSDNIEFDYLVANELHTFKGYLNLYPEGF